MIGDGHSIDAIQDSWISELSLSRWPSFFSTDVSTDLRVKDLITSDPPSWHTPLVTSLFGKELSRRILSIPLISGPSADVRLWQRSSLSRAPFRDLMKIFRPQSQVTKEAAWIWTLPTLPRIQLFMWKLLWDCLPTCALLSRRGVSIQPTCPLCASEDESTDHAIFRCPRASQIWLLVGYRYRVDASGSPRLLFFQDIRMASQHTRGLWAVTAYQIWLSRNQIIFSEDFISPQRLVRKIRSLTADCARATLPVGTDISGLWGSPAVSTANRRTVFISWEPPPPGFVKINFDGSVRGRSAGSAFIIRGPQGDMLAAGGFGSLDSSVPMAELNAAWAGISYASQTLRAQRLVIEGDSRTVIQWLRKEGSPEASSNLILRDIWSILQEVDAALIRHVFREANSAADWVAAAVAQHGGARIWTCNDPCPSILSQILYSDVSGVTYTRLV